MLGNVVLLKIFCGEGNMKINTFSVYICINKSDLNGSTLVICTGQQSIDNTENSENLTILYVVSKDIAERKNFEFDSESWTCSQKIVSF